MTPGFAEVEFRSCCRSCLEYLCCSMLAGCCRQRAVPGLCRVRGASPEQCVLGCPGLSEHSRDVPGSPSVLGQAVLCRWPVASTGISQVPAWQECPSLPGHSVCLPLPCQALSQHRCPLCSPKQKELPVLSQSSLLCGVVSPELGHGVTGAHPGVSGTQSLRVWAILAFFRCFKNRGKTNPA